MRDMVSIERLPPPSRYPVIVHLENHCSIKQQQIMASLLKTLLGSYLYIHPRDSPKAVTDLSPEELKYKVILKVRNFSNMSVCSI